MVRVLLIIIILYYCTSCSNVDKEKIEAEYNVWQGRKIEIPDSITFVKDIFDTVNINLTKCYKVFSYNDSLGCLNCNLMLSRWNPFIKTIDSLSHGKIKFINVVGIKNIDMLKHIVYTNMFHYPLCIDRDDDICKTNNLSTDYKFRTFLLDENNRVVLIGNPVQNPKIKDLYIRTICEKLNINYSPKAENTPRKNLGVFSQSETKTVQFEIKNPDKKILKIDSVFTSCECTKTKINKTEILQNESAVLTVIYKPDGIGDFIREIYVKIHNEEKPKIFEIEGKIE